MESGATFTEASIWRAFRKHFFFENFLVPAASFAPYQSQRQIFLPNERYS